MTPVRRVAAIRPPAHGWQFKAVLGAFAFTAFLIFLHLTGVLA